MVRWSRRGIAAFGLLGGNEFQLHLVSITPPVASTASQPNVALQWTNSWKMVNGRLKATQWSAVTHILILCFWSLLNALWFWMLCNMIQCGLCGLCGQAWSLWSRHQMQCWLEQEHLDCRCPELKNQIKHFKMVGWDPYAKGPGPTSHQSALYL